MVGIRRQNLETLGGKSLRQLSEMKTHRVMNVNLRVIKPLYTDTRIRVLQPRPQERKKPKTITNQKILEEI